MTEHPITPPPELIQRWSEQFEAGRSLYAMFEDIYRAGADAELEACCMEIIDGEGRFYIDETSDRVRLTEDLWTTRRPKPPSLKEQALSLVEQHEDGWRPSPKDWDTIRRALEALPEDAPHLTITPTGKGLVEAMRSKAPSLKEQALDRCNNYIDPDGIIRRALESLPG